jgi:hypothetical protein
LGIPLFYEEGFIFLLLLFIFSKVFYCSASVVLPSASVGLRRRLVFNLRRTFSHLAK